MKRHIMDCPLFVCRHSTDCDAGLSVATVPRAKQNHAGTPKSARKARCGHWVVQSRWQGTPGKPVTHFF